MRLVTQGVRLSATPWTVAHQAPLSMGKNTGVGCHAHLQGIFPTPGLIPGLPHCRKNLYQLSYQGSPFINYLWLMSLTPLSQGSSML